MSVLTRLKKKWGIQSNWDLFLINVVFALAGMMVAVGRKPIFAALGLTPETNIWIKTILYLLLVFPLYQMGLLFFGLILGQFNFFWRKEKALGRWFLKKIMRRRTASDKSEPRSPTHTAIQAKANE